MGEDNKLRRAAGNPPDTVCASNMIRSDVPRTHNHGLVLTQGNPIWGTAGLGLETFACNVHGTIIRCRLSIKISPETAEEDEIVVSVASDLDVAVFVVPFLVLLFSFNTQLVPSLLEDSDFAAVFLVTFPVFSTFPKCPFEIEVNSFLALDCSPLDLFSPAPFDKATLLVVLIAPFSFDASLFLRFEPFSTLPVVPASFDLSLLRDVVLFTALSLVFSLDTSLLPDEGSPLLRLLDSLLLDDCLREALSFEALVNEISFFVFAASVVAAAPF